MDTLVSLSLFLSLYLHSSSTIRGDWVRGMGFVYFYPDVGQDDPRLSGLVFPQGSYPLVHSQISLDPSCGEGFLAGIRSFLEG